MINFVSRHAIGILVFAAIMIWGLFYLPTTPSYAIFELKQAVDARDGDAAARYVDFESVVRNAGYEVVESRAANGDVISALIGKGAVDALSRPLSSALEMWARRKVEDGARQVQMPAAAVAGAILLLHHSGDTASTSFRDDQGREWKATMSRRNGGWQIVEVKNIEQLLDKLNSSRPSYWNQAPSAPVQPPAVSPPTPSTL